MEALSDNKLRIHPLIVLQYIQQKGVIIVSQNSFGANLIDIVRRMTTYYPEGYPIQKENNMVCIAFVCTSHLFFFSSHLLLAGFSLLQKPIHSILPN
jgi:hypothetical protein